MELTARIRPYDITCTSQDNKGIEIPASQFAIRTLHIDIVDEAGDGNAPVAFAVLHTIDYTLLDISGADIFSIYDNIDSEFSEAGEILAEYDDSSDFFDKWLDEYQDENLSLTLHRAGVYMQTIFVEPEHRGKRIGNFIIRNLENFVYAATGALASVIAIIPEPMDYVNQKQVGEKKKNDPEMLALQIRAIESHGFKKYDECTWVKECLEAPALLVDASF